MKVKRGLKYVGIGAGCAVAAPLAAYAAIEVAAAAGAVAVALGVSEAAVVTAGVFAATTAEGYMYKKASQNVKRGFREAFSK